MDEYTKALYIVSDDKDVSTAYIDPSIGEYEFSVEPVPKNLQKIKKGGIKEMPEKKNCLNCDECIKQPEGFVCICENSEHFLEIVDTSGKCLCYKPLDDE